MTIYRRGVLGTGVLYIIYLLMMVMILGGIYGGLIAYFGKGYDFRQIEANVLFSHVKECLKEKGIFKDGKEFYASCNIDETVVGGGDYLVYLKKSNGDEFFVGVYDFKNRCGLVGSDKNKNFPLCSTEEVYINGEKIELTVASNQNSRRVSA